MSGLQFGNRAYFSGARSLKGKSLEVPAAKLMQGLSRGLVNVTNTSLLKGLQKELISSNAKLQGVTHKPLLMEYETPEITMNEGLIIAAKKPIERMLAISKQYGL